MASVFDCTEQSALISGLRAARMALASGQLVVTPTDTVYGIAADAFNATAVQGLLDAKQRGRDFPPPVLVADESMLGALAGEIPLVARALIREFWPGALTLIFAAQPTLDWDLGDTHGTVALRMPDHDVALELLRDVGPLAVSSANTHGLAAALNAQTAREMLGDAVAVYLDGGDAPGGSASTIVDVTRATAESVISIVRHGAIPDEDIARVAAASQVSVS